VMRVEDVPAAIQVDVPGLVNGSIIGNVLRLPAYSAVFASVH
jgi:hypothetical protein